ncbi:MULTISPECIES: FAD-binding protein [Actinomadura]|uniref:FAD-binding protein n=1 Tax=Actinomadura litoris TaxID=2678616 RepID=A0A7K1KX65_9ACTN|nr:MULTISPECIES: FAD-binding protein [Actinomadura]MBT2210904.1 FAD-binding protein [Actinomadura sp. NEAU-AAG7]MUN36798.1 FAD-binding protein [Actinomadura litoris]
MLTTRPAANWAGNVVFQAARVHRPASLDELRRIVAGAARVKALGSGHSFSAVADTTGDLVRVDGLPRAIEIDPSTGTAAVSAGLPYADVAAALHRAGLALPNMASLPHISVAGSCATATHGSGNALRVLASSVSALQLVGPGGDLVELSRDADPGVFPGAVVALGALGVVTRITLDVEPEFEVAQRVLLAVPLDEVAARFEEVSGAAYSVSVFTDWRDPDASVWLKHRADRPGSGWEGGLAADAPVHMVPGMPTESCTGQLGLAGPWHERLPHFRPGVVPGAGEELQSEYFLPREAAASAFAALRGLADLLGPVLHIAEVRTVRADGMWLSPAFGRDSVTLHFTWVRDAAAVAPVLAAVEDRLVPLGARPHWGKLTAMTGKEIAALYPRADRFAALLRDRDPDGTFRNPFLDELFPPD